MTDANTKPFTVMDNAILLRHNVAAICAIHGLRVVDLSDFPVEKQTAYIQAVQDMDLPDMDVPMWYASHWRLFPFSGPKFSSLTMVNRTIVECTIGTCREMAEIYGKKIW